MAGTNYFEDWDLGASMKHALVPGGSNGDDDFEDERIAIGLEDVSCPVILL
ncbi:unnamed protein product [Ilex paraguariensis]|uniref:Uncharacterized protein n=1 Tax=Ilex paraguariensis TaxID=185542 RepID=A0ABC8RGH6_9AQUA